MLKEDLKYKNKISECITWKWYNLQAISYPPSLTSIQKILVSTLSQRTPQNVVFATYEKQACNLFLQLIIL